MHCRARNTAQRSCYQNDLSLLHVCRKAHKLVSRECNERDRRRVRQVHAIRQMGHARIVHCHQLGIGRIGKCKNAVAGLEVLHIGATARTMPLTSRPRITGNDNGKSFCRIPERTFQSIGLTLAAAAAISTVLPLICGSGTLSSNFSFSGPPYSCSTTALITYLPELQVYSVSKSDAR